MPLLNKPQPPSDDDPFPFGKHKGERYGDVPAGYLDYVVGQEWITKWVEVIAYVKANRKEIDKELNKEADERQEKSYYDQETKPKSGFDGFNQWMDEDDIPF